MAGGERWEVDLVGVGRLAPQNIFPNMLIFGSHQVPPPSIYQFPMHM